LRRREVDVCRRAAGGPRDFWPARRLHGCGFNRVAKTHDIMKDSVAARFAQTPIAEMSGQDTIERMPALCAACAS